MGIELVPAPVDCFACAGGQEPLCTSLAAGATTCSGELGLPGTGECLSSLLTARLAELGDRGGLLWWSSGIPVSCSGVTSCARHTAALCQNASHVSTAWLSDLGCCNNHGLKISHQSGATSVGIARCRSHWWGSLYHMHGMSLLSGSKFARHICRHRCEPRSGQRCCL